MQQSISNLQKQRHRKYMTKGIAFAVASGICYGLYTAFLTLGETQGVWAAWFGGEGWNGNAPLSTFAITFTLAALAAGLNDTFGYQIFKGTRKASRDKVLQLAFAMHLGLRETDRLLQAAGANELYCKNRRDAIIIFAVQKGYTLQKANEELYRFGEETIC